MKKNILAIAFLLSLTCVLPTFAATVIKKEDAAQFSKKSIYAEVNVKEEVVTDDTKKENDDAVNRFTCNTATRTGNTYTNVWSNYKITFSDPFSNANDFYDYYADGMRFDFGIQFEDYSRIAVYYSRLSRDISIITANFAPGQEANDVVVAGETYKHVTLDVPYPYGVEKYEYFLRAIDGKLMVIELFYEDEDEISPGYIDEFIKLS